MDRSFIEKNCASTERIRLLAARMMDEEMQTKVAEHWTVGIVFAHLAWWVWGTAHNFSPEDPE